MSLTHYLPHCFFQRVGKECARHSVRHINCVALGIFVVSVPIKETAVTDFPHSPHCFALVTYRYDPFLFHGTRPQGHSLPRRLPS
jgi:hypothetical protein